MSKDRPPVSRKSVRRALDAFRTRSARRRSPSAISGSESGLIRAGTPAEVTSVRAKSSRHRKSTADKWNQ
jgi:hypothetical protein